MATYYIDLQNDRDFQTLQDLMRSVESHDGDLIYMNQRDQWVSQAREIAEEEDQRILSAMAIAASQPKLEIQNKIEKLFGKGNCKFEWDRDTNLLMVYVYRNFSQEKANDFLKTNNNPIMVAFKNLEKNKMKFMVKVV
jgi:hypothetical protein